MNTAKRFIPLERPQTGNIGLGWYIASFEIVEGTFDQYYYLHDDGFVRDGCSASRSGSTGWFPNATVAFDAGREYYNKHGIVYPYALCADGKFYNLDGSDVSNDTATDTIESEEMIF